MPRKATNRPTSRHFPQHHALGAPADRAQIEFLARQRDDVPAPQGGRPTDNLALLSSSAGHRDGQLASANAHLAPRTPEFPSPIEDFVWDVKSERAVVMVADGSYSDTQICRALSLNLRSLSAWKRHPGFRQRAFNLVSIMAESLSGHVLATKAGRARNATAILDALAQVRQERIASTDPSNYFTPDGDALPTSLTPAFEFNEELAQQPGGTSGLLVKRQKVIGTGDAATMITEYVLDNDLVRATQEVGQYAAKELGQWVDKHQEESVQKLYIGIDIDQL